MDQPRKKTEAKDRRPVWVEGLGVLCAEAQADGVPCGELGRDCDVCDRAQPGPPGKRPHVSRADEADAESLGEGDW